MNNKIILPILIIAIVLIGGGILLANPNIISKTHQANNFSTQPANSPPASTEGSGIEGTVMVGPTCGGPVQAEPGDPRCADKPYSTTFNLYSKAGPGDGAQKFVMSFKSDANGKFKVNLPPGGYEIRAASNSSLPRMSPQYVVVTPDAFTTVNLQFDSGLL